MPFKLAVKRNAITIESENLLIENYGEMKICQKFPIFAHIYILSATNCVSWQTKFAGDNAR